MESILITNSILLILIFFFSFLIIRQIVINKKPTLINILGVLIIVLIIYPTSMYRRSILDYGVVKETKEITIENTPIEVKTLEKPLSNEEIIQKNRLENEKSKKRFNDLEK